MKNNKVFIAYHCENSSSYIEQSLLKKKYYIIKKKCNGVEILRYIINKKPDICILKSSYKDLSGLEIIKEATLKNSNTKFFLFFNKVSEIDIAMAMQINVSGCISCDDDITEVLTCLNKVHNNERYFSKKLYAGFDKNKLKEYTNFTDFQTKIIAYIGFYASPEKLAKKLNTSITSVNREIDIIQKRLCLTANQPLHLWAVKNTSFIETLLFQQPSYS